MLDLMGVIVKLLMLVVLSHMITLHFCVVRGRMMRKISKEEDLEFENQLKILNKPPIKTIQTEEGDTIDCIDIYKQPAFDNPLLVNHKIQMRPSSLPEGLSYIGTSSSSSSPVAGSLDKVLKHYNCPKGTVPIQRTRKEDLIRAKYFSESFKPNTIHPHRMEEPSPPGQLLAIRHSYNTTPYPYFGLQVHISADNPLVTKDQFSSSQVWLETGSADNFSSIQAGWAVAPSLFGDDKTRFFAYWHSKVGATTSGCFNLLCPGFIQVDPSYRVGLISQPISQYGGAQYYHKVKIIQDPGTFNWLFIGGGDRDVYIGYWPREVVPYLSRGAKYVAWGGLARSTPNTPTPQMGKGYFPDGDITKASGQWNIHYVDANNKLVEPRNLMEFVNHEDNPDCYRFEDDRYRSEQLGYTILFGGPGGNC